MQSHDIGRRLSELQNSCLIHPGVLFYAGMGMIVSRLTLL